MKHILAISASFAAFLLAALVSQFFVFTNLATLSIHPLLTVIVSFSFCALFFLYLAITTITLHTAEIETSPGITFSVLNDRTLTTLSLYLFLFPVISLLFTLSPVSFPYWIISFGLAIDAFRAVHNKLALFISPRHYMHYLACIAMDAAKKDRVESMLITYENVFSIIHHLLSKHNTMLSLQLIKSAGALTNDLLEVTATEKSTRLKQTLDKLLNRYCENCEVFVVIALHKRLPLLVETILHTLRLTICETVLDSPDHASISLGCLHKCTDHILKGGNDIFIAPISTVMMCESASKLLDHVDCRSVSIARFYSDLIQYVEYFTPTNPLPRDEAMIKSLILDGFGTLVLAFKRHPAASCATFQPLNQHLIHILTTHQQAAYAQHDGEYHQKLSAFIEDAIKEGESKESILTLS